MQTRYTARLSRKLASYARKHSLSETARQFGIIDPDGKPSRALTRLLINGYEPRKPETRQRLGLPLEIKEPRKPHPVTINQLLQLPISEMPPEILRLAFEYRHEHPIPVDLSTPAEVTA